MRHDQISEPDKDRVCTPAANQALPVENTPK